MRFMNSITISEIWIYPIKSLRGVRVSRSVILEKGLQFDRRWMLIDENNNFISQRQHPELALFNVSLADGFIHVKFNGSEIKIPLTISNEYIRVSKVWSSSVNVLESSSEISHWFSAQLNFKCRLVFFPESHQRKVENPYSNQLSLADAYPILLIGQSSLDDLNNRMNAPLPMNRFRPNIVVTGSAAFAEDNWKSFSIGTAQFFGSRPSYRCIVTTTNQETGERGVEPLRTLSKYRKKDNQIFFGQNVLVMKEGAIHESERLLIT